MTLNAYWTTWLFTESSSTVFILFSHKTKPRKTRPIFLVAETTGDSYNGAFDMSGKNENIGNNGLPGSSKINQPVLFVAPLNSVPYLGSSSSYTASMSTNKSKGNAEKSEPAMIFLPNQSSQEVNDLAAQTKTGVVLTGSAALGLIGPTIGRMDVFDSDDSYFFRVSLPCVSSEEKEFICDIEENGTIVIKGATTTGEETVCRHSQVFKMLSQNLCPSGRFTISFKLPGPVNNEDFTGNIESGVLEGVVKKLRKNSESEI